MPGATCIAAAISSVVRSATYRNAIAVRSRGGSRCNASHTSVDQSAGTSNRGFRCRIRASSAARRQRRRTTFNAVRYVQPPGDAITPTRPHRSYAGERLVRRVGRDRRVAGHHGQRRHELGVLPHVPRLEPDLVHRAPSPAAPCFFIEVAGDLGRAPAHPATTDQAAPGAPARTGVARTDCIRDRRPAASSRWPGTPRRRGAT